MIQKVPGATTYIDVLDRVLDKGIVFDAWMRVSVAGIDLITVDTHVIVASIETYLKYRRTFGPAAARRSKLSPSLLTPTVSEDSGFPMSPVLFIIAADRPDLFEKWTAVFPDLAVRHVVVLDRRRHERRRQLQPVREDRRRAERRTRKIDRELELFGMTAVALTAEV